MERAILETHLHSHLIYDNDYLLVQKRSEEFFKMVLDQLNNPIFLNEF